MDSKMKPLWVMYSSEEAGSDGTVGIIFKNRGGEQAGPREAMASTPLPYCPGWGGGTLLGVEDSWKVS